MKLPSLIQRTSTLLPLLCLLPLSPARAVVDDVDSQYCDRYGKAQQQVEIDPKHRGLVYKKPPFTILVVYENGRSVGEIINKATDMSAIEIDSVLKANAHGVAWRKENITKSKGDDEKMRAQGVLDVQMWSRTDGKLFASYLHTKAAGNEAHAVLIGNKQGVKIVTELSQSHTPLQFKPIQQ